VLSLPALVGLLASAPAFLLEASPILGVLGMLAAAIGLPYVLLASTSPLLQAWLAGRPGAKLPYRLYALSNLAALGALVGYPVLVEPFVPWRRQAIGWAVGYAGFAVLSILAARRTARTPPSVVESSREAVDATAPPTWAERALWTYLAACPALLLVAVTSHITQHIVPAPLLWVLPLAAYLLSFVLCFEWPRLYWRPLWMVLLAGALVGLAYLMRLALTDRAALRVALIVDALFVCCMACHGEIVRRRPGAPFLTTYYLLIALGGALGGLFAGVVAPLAFAQLAELPIGLIVTALVAVLVSLLTLWPRVGPYWRMAAVGVLPFALGVYSTYVVHGMQDQVRGYRLVMRSFYGQLDVEDHGVTGSENSWRTLVHGGIIHGTQWQHDARRREPTSYYCEDSGVGQALANLPEDRSRRVGMVGLGVGTLLTFGRPGDVYRVYEINPQVLRLAVTEFTFLGESRADVSVIIGDARQELEREPPQGFDLIAVDAFSGDAIPGHLLTREALELYTRHLRPDGILAVHISNRFVELEPVLAAGAHALGRPAINASADPSDSFLCYHSDWILVMPRGGRTLYPALWEIATELTLRPGFRPWTDELWSLYPLLRLRR
jgi:SAM-dependent methyltransferase